MHSCKVFLKTGRLQPKSTYFFSGDFFSVTDICKKPQIRTRDIINDVYSFFLIMEKNEVSDVLVTT